MTVITERERKRRSTPEFKEKANIYQRDYRRRKREALFALKLKLSHSS